MFLVVTAAVGYFVWKVVKAYQSADAHEDGPLRDLALLGQEVKALSVELSIPIKNELRNLRVASSYDDLFAMDWFGLITRFAAIRGRITAAAGAVFLAVLTALHPKQYAGLSADDAAALMSGHVEGHPEDCQPPFAKPFLLRIAERAGESVAAMLREEMYKVALQVALADGPLSPVAQIELHRLRSTTAPTVAPQTAASSSKPRSDSDRPNSIIAETPSGQSVEAGESPEQATHPESLEAQSQSSTRDRNTPPSESPSTLAVLTERTKELVDALEPLLKFELRKSRRSSSARDLLEQDIRTIIIRFGTVEGTVSEDAARVYIEVFKRLHPRTYSGWRVENALDFLQRSLDMNRASYSGPLIKPYTLGIVEEFEAAHGSHVVKLTRDLMLTHAVFSSSVHGQVTDRKKAEITEFKTILEA